MGEFSVCQFFKDGTSDYECRWVDINIAINTFARLSTNVAAKLGITRRVIITDSGDCVNAEWQYGRGVTFPPELRNVDLKRLCEHAEKN